MKIAGAILFAFLVGCVADEDFAVEELALDEQALSAAQLRQKAKSFASSFDFAAESSATEIPRDIAGTVGPTAVRRAHALHRSWENNDLGVVRLYRWTLLGYRVWAIRTSTDGDDSFVELFNAVGDWLATGTGGFVPDADSESGFKPIITWDSVFGAVRNEIAPKDISPDVVSFWLAADATLAEASPLAARISVVEARNLLKAALADELTTASLGGWEQAAMRRLLADPTVSFTAAARQYCEQAVGFYEQDFGNIINIVTPSIVAALNLPAALNGHIFLSRGKIAGGTFAQAGQGAMIKLALALGVLPTSALPSNQAALKTSLIAAGASPAQATNVLSLLGADVAFARIFSGSVFTQDENFSTVAEPGTVWFIASPAKATVGLVRLVP